MSRSSIKIWLFLSVLSLSISCDKERRVSFLGEFDASFDIPSGLNTIETHFFVLRNVPTFYSTKAALAGVDTSNVANINSGKGLMKNIFSSQHLDFIEEISVLAISRKNPEIRREMYYLEFVPFNTNTEMRFLSSTTELKEVLSEDFIDLEVRINLRSFVPGNIRTTLNLSYVVYE